MTIELTTENFDATISKGGIVFVDIWAPWCAPCKVMSPIVDELAGEMEGVTITKLNADDHPDIPRQFNVLSIPTYLIFKGGQAVDQFQGAMSKDALRERIARHM